MTRLVCPSCGVVHKAPFHPENEDFNCSCGGRRVLPSALKPRKPLRRISEKKAPQARKRGSTLKQGPGFAASKAQREKVRGLPCIGCGREATEDGRVAIDPAHIWDKSKGGCNHPDCVGPLCRGFDYSCHRLFEEGKLDLLPRLVSLGCYAELGHVITVHHVSPLTLTEHVTGQRYEPVREAA